MDKLNKAVTARLADDLFTPQRIDSLLAKHLDRQMAREAGADKTTSAEIPARLR